MNPQKVAEEVSLYFGVEFAGEIVQLDGGLFPCIRPIDLEKGNGFCLAFSKTTKFIEGSFHLDRFGGGLLRKMQNADEDQYHLFNELLDESIENGYSTEIILNSENIAELKPDTISDWKTFELSITIRYQNGNLDDLFRSLVTTLVSLALALLPIHENNLAFEEGRAEGSRYSKLISAYERSPINRARCLQYHGLNCKICGFNFENKYGPLGIGFIEVHHIIPVSTIGSDIKINPIKDLIPLCSNCHSMIHRRNPPLNPDELKRLISGVLS